MARVLVSPGVLTREIDNTFLPSDSVGTSPVIIAPRAKGPAMEPVLLKDLDADAATFGLPVDNGRDFGAYAARTYLKQQQTPLTFVRVLGQSGTGVTSGFEIEGPASDKGMYVIGASGSAGGVVAVILASGAVSLAGTLTSSVSSLAISVAGYGEYTASLLRTDSNYIKNVFNTDPTQFSTRKHVVYAVYDFGPKTATANKFYAAAVAGGYDFKDAYITGTTTAVISQPFDGVEYTLFSFGSRYAGDSANTEIKVSIQDIKKSLSSNATSYGSFTVVVRKFFDSDRAPEVLEVFQNCNLNPSDRNYIARRIGTRYKVWNSTNKKFDEFGDWDNKSKYIYVNESTDLLNGAVPAVALPWGFRGYPRLNNDSVSGQSAWPSMPYVQDSTFNGTFNTKVYWGVEVFDNSANTINHGIVDKLKHLGARVLGASGTVDSNFSLKYLSGAIQNVSGYSSSTRLTEAAIAALSTSLSYSVTTTPIPGTSGWLSVDNIENTALAKFTMPIFDGFDGVDIKKSNPFDPANMTSATAYEAHAYRTALDIISNADDFDTNLVALPGVHASVVTTKAQEVVEDRGDSLYLLDISGSTVDAAISDVSTRNLDSNYMACYYPWIRMYEDTSDRVVNVPPTVIMPAVIAYSDKVSWPWFAPAGLGRGALKRFRVVEARDKLTNSDRDRLYENRINPIATFPGEGPVVWGQKTLQVAESALTRINVRRLMLELRKRIAKVGRELIFEPNVSSTWQKFSNKVQPYLERVQQNAGLADFKVVMDNRTNTEDLVERNIMYGKIAIKPTRTAEYIYLDFFLTNNVAGFEE